MRENRRHTARRVRRGPIRHGFDEEDLIRLGVYGDDDPKSGEPK